MKKIILDSNSVINVINGDKNLIEYLYKETDKQILIPSVVIAEVLSKSDLRNDEMVHIFNFFNSVIIIDMDFHIAYHASHIRRTYKLKIPDSIVVASAISEQGILLSRDKDLLKVRELQLLNI